MKQISIPTEDERKMLLLYVMGTLHVQKQDAEDLVQNAMIKYWQHFSKDFIKTEDIENPRKYLAAVVRHLFLDNARKVKKELNFSEVLFELEKFIVHDPIMVEKIERTADNYISSLTGDVKIVIQLYTEGKTPREIVKLTGFRYYRVSNILKRDRNLGRLLRKIEIDYPL